MQSFSKRAWQRRLALLSVGSLLAAAPCFAQTAAPTTEQNPPATKEPRPALRDVREENRETREANRDNREATREQNRDNREATRDQNRDNRSTAGSPVDRREERIERREERRDRIFSRLGVALNAAANGLTLSNVQPNSTFGTAGFQNNDVILRAGDRRFTDNAAFQNWLMTVQPGKQLGIVVQRNGREETINWTPTEQQIRDFTAQEQVSGSNAALGITLDQQQTQAAIVAEVAPGSLAERAGIRARDQIVSLNGEKINNAQDFQNLSSRIDANGQAELGFSRVVSLHSAAKPVIDIQIPLPERHVAPATLPMPVTPRSPQPNPPRIDPAQANPGVTPPLPR